MDHAFRDSLHPTTDDRQPTTDSRDKVTRRQGDKVTESEEAITRSPLYPFTPSEESKVTESEEAITRSPVHPFTPSEESVVRGRWSVVSGQWSVLIGSDIPDLPAAYVRDAFARLESGADVVLGPAEDGGYYLIGLRAPQPGLLRGVPMSTPTVLADTLALAREQGLRADLLPPWSDIDTIADLQQLAARLRDAPPDVALRTRAFLVGS
jgi:hypothetical protein